MPARQCKKCIQVYNKQLVTYNSALLLTAAMGVLRLRTIGPRSRSLFRGRESARRPQAERLARWRAPATNQPEDHHPQWRNNTVPRSSDTKNRMTHAGTPPTKLLAVATSGRRSGRHGRGAVARKEPVEDHLDRLQASSACTGRIRQSSSTARTSPDIYGAVHRPHRHH